MHPLLQYMSARERNQALQKCSEHLLSHCVIHYALHKSVPITVRYTGQQGDTCFTSN